MSRWVLRTSHFPLRGKTKGHAQGGPEGQTLSCKPPAPQSLRFHIQSSSDPASTRPHSTATCITPVDRPGTYLCLYLSGHRPGSVKTKPSEVIDSDAAHHPLLTLPTNQTGFPMAWATVRTGTSFLTPGLSGRALKSQLQDPWHKIHLKTLPWSHIA